MGDDLKYKELKKKLEERNRGLKERIITKHKEAFDWAQNNTKQLAAGAMGGLLLLTTPASNFLPKPNDSSTSSQFVDLPQNMFVISDLKQYLPDIGQEYTSQQEERVAHVLTDDYGIPVKADIGGLRLNTTYGYIGLEQHLMRYPGDVVENMAPGRGGFGYFASSKDSMTEEDMKKEMYYIAVQTFLAPDFAAKKWEYIKFFKFRKMLVVNPNNGRAVVAVIGDAGPAVWTGKQLGGSPEVMEHLQRVDGRDKGAVLYFFIDDPEDKIPLGPIMPKSKS